MITFLKHCFWIFLIPALLQANEDELLPAERAFLLTANLNESDQIQLNWDIAPGYYLYREKFAIDLNGQKIAYTDLTLPKGIQIDDPLFGEVTIYKNALQLQLDNNSDLQIKNLNLTYQGCYEPLGICYPPQTKTLSFTSINLTQPLLEEKNEGIATAKTGIFSEGTVFSANKANSDDFLPVDQAFQLVFTQTETHRIVANFEATEGYYLYKPHIKFKSDNPDIVLSEISYPTGKLKDDPHFGNIEVYYGNATIPISLARLTTDNNLSLTAQYQGCAEDGICYEPQSKQFEITLAAIDVADIRNDNDNQRPEKSLIWVLLLAFGGGLLLTFTPCVLPMIPILSGIIMAEKGKGGIHHAGLLSVIYVLGTSVSYTMIGAVAGASGEQLQAYFQTPLAIGFLCLLLITMSLSMFGLFKLQLPAFMQTRLSGQSQKMAGGGAISVFSMGMFSALIVGACVSPLLISTLSLAIAKGSALLGAALMFSMAMGMGVVLILFGFGFGHFIPKTGAWMEGINKLIGFLLLAVALYLLGFIPSVPVLFLWSLLLICLGFFLLAKTNRSSNQAINIISKAVAVISIVWGALALIGGLNGYRDILNPLPIKQMLVSNPTSATSHSQLFTVATTNAQIDELFVQANDQNKMVMMDYYADWCLDCLRMDESTFKDPQIAKTLEDNFITIKVDVTNASDENVKAIKKRFKIFGPPATLFFNHNSVEKSQYNFYGYRDSDTFMEILNNVISQR